MLIPSRSLIDRRCLFTGGGSLEELELPGDGGMVVWVGNKDIGEIPVGSVDIGVDGLEGGNLPASVPRGTSKGEDGTEDFCVFGSGVVATNENGTWG